MSSTDTQKLVSDVKTLLADSEDLIKATAAQTGEKVVELRARIQHAAAEIKPRLAGVEERVERKVRLFAHRGDSFVHANAWSAIGVAAGAAFVLGMLAGRRQG